MEKVLYRGTSGEVPQYYVEGSHPAIMTAEMFDMIQEELARRKRMGRQHNATSCFSGMIFCGCCGGMYGSKVWHSNDKYRRVVWQCNAKFKGEHRCTTPHLTDAVLQERFILAINRLIAQRDFIAQDTKAIVDFLTDTKALDAEAHELNGEIEIVKGLMKQAIAQNASTVLDQEEYERRYNALAERFNKAADRLRAIQEECAQRATKKKGLNAFMKLLMESDEKVTEFTPMLWNSLLDKVIVAEDGGMRFIFRNGMEISA